MDMQAIANSNAGYLAEYKERSKQLNDLCDRQRKAHLKAMKIIAKCDRLIVRSKKR